MTYNIVSNNHKTASCHAFTMLELAVVLIAVSFLIGMSITAGQMQIQVADTSATKTRIGNIAKSLAYYHQEHGAYPCPADITVTTDHAASGVPNANQDCGTSADIINGAVPYTVLGLKAADTVDSWGNNIVYAVDSLLTDTSSAAAQTGRIVVQTSIAGQTLAANTPNHPLGGAAFVLLSHGENGNGAFVHKTGSQVPGQCDSGIADSENCFNVADGFTHDVFMDDENVIAENNAEDAMDDIIFWIVQDNVRAYANFDPAAGYSGSATTTDLASSSFTVFDTLGGSSGEAIGSGGTNSNNSQVFDLGTVVSGSSTTTATTNNNNNNGNNGNNGNNNDNSGNSGGNNNNNNGNNSNSGNTNSTTVIRGNLTAGVHHVCYANEVGDAWCWGKNDALPQEGDPTPSGLLGNGTTVNANTPQQITTTQRRFSRIFSAPSFLTKHSCAIGFEGKKAYCWGRGSEGQLGNGSFTMQALSPVEVTGLPADRIITSLSVAGNTTVISLDDGSAWMWGSNRFGVLGKENPNNTNVPVQIDSTVIEDVKQISASDNPGDNKGTSTEGAYCALKNNGTVWCWGRSYPYFPETVTPFYPNTHRDTWQTGTEAKSIVIRPIQVDLGGAQATYLAAGGVGHCALTDQGINNLYCWGNNNQLRYGWSTYTSRSIFEPFRFSMIGDKVIDISPGDGSGCAVTQSGGVWCWGSNTSGEAGRRRASFGGDQLPNDDLSNYVVNAEKVTVGNSHGCIYQTDNQIRCFGETKYGQFGNGSDETFNDAEGSTPYHHIPLTSTAPNGDW